MRMPDARRAKGKRSGSRVIYLYLPDARWFFMLDIYGKDEKDDLSPSEKLVLAGWAEKLKQQARQVRTQRRKL